MSQSYQSIKGMKDILPDQSSQWQRLESVLSTMASQHGFDEIRLPIVEHTDLFARTIGEATDVVHKEMYSFEDRNGERLTLRPEGTAGCMRSIIQHDLCYGQVQRLYYVGPMFRHERPQKGRYRQFHHFGMEAVGMKGPAIEAELINFVSSLWQRLGVDKKMVLQLNSLGTPTVRTQHREALVAYLSEHHDQLDADSQKRLHENPLRVLDSKNPEMQSIIQAAPQLSDFYDEESTNHFATLRALLDGMGIAYQVNPYLVRGLDYYGHTVFEWVADDLAAQGTVCGGGRYDALVEQLGGRPTPAVGFAMGLERLLLLMDAPAAEEAMVIYCVYDPQATVPMMRLANQIRDRYEGARVLVHGGGGGFKSQFKQADRSGATVVLVMGENELKDKAVSIKHMRGASSQQTVALDEVTTVLDDITANQKGKEDD